MAWGTSSFPKVEKIFGPGNQYVTAAKMILQNSEAVISIDMPAGPSEVLVIADKHANPVHITADLLSQILIEVDHLQDVPTPYIQIKGVDKEAVGLMMRLDGFYTTKSYLEIILESLPQVERTSSSIRTQQAVKLQELMDFILSQGSSSASECSPSRIVTPVEAAIEDMQCRIKRLERWQTINTVLWTFLMSALVGYSLYKRRRE